MANKLSQLKTLLAEIDDLRRIQSVLNWDQQTYMPSGAADARGYQMSALARLEHERWVSPRLGKLLDQLSAQASGLDPDSDDACLLRVARVNFEKHNRISAAWVNEFAQVTTLGQEAWIAARRANDFASFRPHLEKIVELRRAYAAFFAPYEHVYDPLLDDFESGMKTAEVREIFDVLRPEQVTLLRAIAARPQIDDSFLHLEFDEQGQWDFGIEILTQFGYDFKYGRLDRAAHPFSSSLGQGDVRITTRFNSKQVTSGMFGTMHECGHALYDLGIDPALARSPLAEGASMAIHESQSRLWENLVGHSFPFWKFFYPRLQSHFPTQLDKVSLEDFFRGINRVEPSLIRTEADEATYNLHIMLRLEMEIALMEGSLEVRDLPAVWNQRMEENLGLTPPDDADGVLQDIHWSGGLFGYFPTYALGNLVSAQLWEKIRADIPGLDGQIEQGQFTFLLAWLRTNIHRHGAKYKPQELVQRVTGEKINPHPYLRYLKAKFSAVYEF
jgi:carboxypeptidase Taq